MKFKFKIQDYQTEAVEAVVKVFEGQPFNNRVSYLRDLGNQTTPIQTSLLADDLQYVGNDGSGFGNATIELSDSQLLENIRALQLGNSIKQSSALSKPFGAGCRCALDIEMETGTGKTYCYIKTMFELNKKYGWSKFIVVVPSIAIREGVKKSFEVMEDHFFEQYNKKARFFVYNSKNLNLLDNFSASKDINVMIINAQAFASSLKEGAKNEAARIIYSKQDSFGSRRPIDVIAANRPIIILDEPQKLGGDATQSSIKLFKPLFSLNYSATHKDVHNLVYVLDALDAYQKKLVKKIEVKGFEQHNLRGTGGFVYLSQILVDPKKPPRARLTFEVRRANLGIERISRLCSVDDNLYALSAGKTNSTIEQYKNGFIIKEINPINSTVTFLNGEVLSVGEACGDMTETQMRRIQIRETIQSHFEKEESLFNQGIKCLSLFFIDEVANYRQYDDNGNEVLGDFGVMFEQEYISVLNEYLSLIETPYIKYLKSIDVHDTHKGYFSIDKKTNRAVNSVEKKGVCDDISAYDLILKNKERLLSFEEPTRFIFSHSALREGWDNPNVFQICTLKQSNSEISKRQEVGRGMRLCVNQAGDRMDFGVLSNKVHEVNTLTIIASESYKTFAGDLQRELKSTLYDRPTKATIEYFEGKTVQTADGNYIITKADASDIFVYLRSNGYVDREGNVKDEYRNAQAANDFAPLPPELVLFADGIHKLVQGIFDEKVLKEMVEPAVKTKITQNELNDNFFKKEFQALWKRINHKYAYTVNIDSDKLIEKAIKAIDDKLIVTQTSYQRTIGSQGDTLDFNEEKSKTITLKNSGSSDVAYDLIGKICAGTMLTRKTVAKILKGISSVKFSRFKANPEDFITKTIRLINEQKADMIVDAISYNLTDEVFDNDIFACGAISLDKVVGAERHITPYVVCDSNIERDFAKELELHTEEVCVYAKLPKGFKIPTPVGDYSPDWAIAFYENTVKYIYFVAETKGSEKHRDPIEFAKNSCAEKLFAKLSGDSVKYGVVNSYQQLLDIMN